MKKTAHSVIILKAFHLVVEELVYFFLLTELVMKKIVHSRKKDNVNNIVHGSLSLSLSSLSDF